MNGVSVIGRILPTFLAARFGVINMLCASMYSCAILAFGWIGVKNVGGEVAFSVIFGLFGGARKSQRSKPSINLLNLILQL